MGNEDSQKTERGQATDLSPLGVAAAGQAAQLGQRGTHFPAAGRGAHPGQRGAHFVDEACEAGRVLTRCLNPLSATGRRELLRRVHHDWRSEVELRAWLGRVQAARATIAYLRFFSADQRAGALKDLAGLIFVRLALRADPAALLRWASTYTTLGAAGLLECRGRPRGRKPVSVDLIIRFAERLSRGTSWAVAHRLTLREALRMGEYFPCARTLRDAVKRGDGILAGPKLPRRRVDRINCLLTTGPNKN